MFGFDETPEITSGAQRAAILMAHKINWQGEFYRNLPDPDAIGAAAPSRQVLRHEKRRDVKPTKRAAARLVIKGRRQKSRKLQA